MFFPILATTGSPRRLFTLRAGFCVATLLTAICSASSLQAQAAPNESANRRGAAPLGSTAEPVETTRSTSAALDEAEIIVTSDEFLSAYGSPGGLSRSRFSPITNGYTR